MTTNGDTAGRDAWLWQGAAALAGRMHAGHNRRDGRTPYVTHPFRVCLTLRHAFGCEEAEVLAAALLHDVIEDTTADRDDITEGLMRVASARGIDAAIARPMVETVASLVCLMTKDMRLRESEREPAYDAQLGAGDWRARLIKLADTYDNLRDAADEALLRRTDPARAISSPLAKAERALGLASRDDHEAVRRASVALRGLMTSLGVPAPDA